MRNTLFVAALFGAAGLSPTAASVSAPAEQPAAIPVRTIAAARSFARAPFVHPRIVQEISTPFNASSSPTVVSLTEVEGDDRYDSEVEIVPVEGECPFLRWDKEPWPSGPWAGYFGYQYVGRTDSGVQVLFISESGGGSGSFRNLLLAVIEFVEEAQPAPAAGEGAVSSAGRERIVLRKLDEVPLGDRWDGKIRIRGNELWIGEDNGWFAHATGHSHVHPAPKGAYAVTFTPPAPLDFAAHADSCAARE